MIVRNRINPAFWTVACLCLTAGPVWAGVVGGNIQIPQSGGSFPDLAYSSQNHKYLVVWGQLYQPNKPVAQRAGQAASWQVDLAWPSPVTADFDVDNNVHGPDLADFVPCLNGPTPPSGC